MKNKNVLQVKAILSDAGGILFDDSNVKNPLLDYLTHKVSEDNLLKNNHIPLSQNKIRQIHRSYRIHKARAQTEKEYNNTMAYRDTFENAGLGFMYSNFEEWLAHRSRIKNFINPGVKETLIKLREEKIKFIVMTDATKDSYNLEGQLRDMGIENEITGLISSKDIGVCKPDKRFFDYVLKKYDLRQEDVAFLGHDLDELEGARSLGYATIALNYNPRDSFKLSFSTKIEKFDNLLDIIKNK